MKMHTIEVDDEVLDHLKEKAEPFVDTPNSVLRRELLNKKNLAIPETILPRKLIFTGLPQIPIGIPKALEQILEVTYLVYLVGNTRHEATHYVANKHRVAFQTVLDKYCRQLGLTANQFDTLLRQSDIRDLKARLRSRFNGYSELIEKYFTAKYPNVL